MATNVWLSKWSSDVQSGDPSRRNEYLTIYGVLGSISSVFVMISSFTFASGGLSAAKKIHNAMLKNILRAPMYFFDTNPKGRILNRFAKDTDSIDSSIPASFNTLSRQLYISMMNKIVFMESKIILKPF